MKLKPVILLMIPVVIVGIFIFVSFAYYNNNSTSIEDVSFDSSEQVKEAAATNNELNTSPFSLLGQETQFDSSNKPLSIERISMSIPPEAATRLAFDLVTKNVEGVQNGERDSLANLTFSKENGAVQLDTNNEQTLLFRVYVIEDTENMGNKLKDLTFRDDIDKEDEASQYFLSYLQESLPNKTRAELLPKSICSLDQGYEYEAGRIEYRFEISNEYSAVANQYDPIHFYCGGAVYEKVGKYIIQTQPVVGEYVGPYAINFSVAKFNQVP